MRFLTRRCQNRFSPPAQSGGSFKIARIPHLFRAGFRAEAAKPVEDGAIWEAPRNPVQETARRAPFPARLEPPGATRGPALLTELGVAMGLGAGAGSGRKPPPDHHVSCFAPERIYAHSSPVRRAGPPSPCGSGGPARRRPMDRAGPSAPKTGDYVDWDAWLPVSDPKLRPTRTDPGPEGHVRRESPEAWGGAGGGRAASLGPSAGACALSEPDR